MKKFVVFSLVLSLAIMPFQVWASPGPVDQYGGHNCDKDCYLYNLSDGEYHYHNIPQTPNYLKGSIAKPSESYLYLLPLLKIELFAKQPDILNSELVANSDLDNEYCGGLGIFAKGYYTKDNLVRIKPTCADKETTVMFNTKVITNIYYKEIPNSSDTITKLYHYITVGFNKDIITDRPALSELEGKIIQGATDQAMYYVKLNGGDYELRKISDITAQELVGTDYKNKIIYFDDSIIYTYKIGVPQT
jgi:hypothetical protein